MTQQELEVIAVAKTKCLNSFLFFTRYFFKKRFNRKFVIGDHHVQIADVLERVYKGEIKRLIINIAPRYGKTELAVKNFIANGLAINPASKYIHLSYSDDLALDNSEDTKTIVQSAEYRALFPEVEIKKNSDSKKKWYTTKGGGVYATSAAGQVTGFGAGQVDDEDLAEFEDIDSKNGFGGALIIDDPIKPEDADSELQRERVNTRFDSTIINRVNSRNTPIIVIMQRLHEHDLCGYLTENDGHEWTVLELSCEVSEGVALWPFKHTWEELKVIEKRNQLVYGRQYKQHPMPIEGRLYKKFNLYSELPHDAYKIRAVTDTADTGSDYLCNIIYRPVKTGYYLIDVYYTKKGMEVTEQETAKRLTKYKVEDCMIESNNGGRGFARNVEKICRELGNTSTTINWFHQSDNKEVRIFTKAADVQNMIYYPENWEKLWPEFATHVKGYMAASKNTNDDAEDALTLVFENENKPNNIWGTYV